MHKISMGFVQVSLIALVQFVRRSEVLEDPTDLKMNHKINQGKNRFPSIISMMDSCGERRYDSWVVGVFC